MAKAQLLCCLGPFVCFYVLPLDMVEERREARTSDLALLVKEVAFYHEPEFVVARV